MKNTPVFLDRPGPPQSLPSPTAHGKPTIRHPGALFTTIAAALTLAVVAPARSADITIDAANVIGTIKPLHDVGLGPLNMRDFIDLSDYYRELGIRNVRLHDVPWVYENIQDMNYVFPNEHADPAKPENYDFGRTDHYIESITSLGINIIYRLGYSADYPSPARFQHMDPPTSYEKWSDVAANIVRHYTEGWANGPKGAIRYWEVWNEPDAIPLFWKGTPEQYYRLYEITVRKIKAIDPTLKVGGPALGAFPITPDFLEEFLRYCRDHQVPLDFVSWHSYGPGPHDIARFAKRVRELADRYGFQHAESILDEWSYLPSYNFASAKNISAKQMFVDWLHGEKGAAYNTTVLTDLQDAPVDIATFYTGSTLCMGLFTSMGVPTKAYDSFLAFRRMLDCPQRLAVTKPDQPDIGVLAGISADGSTVRALVSYTEIEDVIVNLSIKNRKSTGSRHYRIQRIDQQHSLAVSTDGEWDGHAPIPLILSGPTVALLTISD